MEIDQKYVMKVFRTVTENPTAQDLDFLVEAHGRIGYYAAVAQGEAERAVDERKYHEATKWREVKDENAKWTAAQVEAAVMVGCYEYRRGEHAAMETAKKMNNLLDTVREAINAIKFLGRNGGGDVRIGP